MKEAARIASMGIENYITNVQNKRAKISSILCSIVSFLIGLILVAITTSIAVREIRVYGRIFGSLEFVFWGGIAAGVLGVLFIGASVYLAVNVFRKNEDPYKEQIEKRHGNYFEVLRAIENQFVGGDVFITKCGAYITKDWLVFLDTRLIRFLYFRPVRFIHKSEIVCLVCVESDIMLILDDGEDFEITANLKEWDDLFKMLSSGNPHILSNNDMITMPNGIQQTAAEAFANKDNSHKDVLKAMLETYQENK